MIKHIPTVRLQFILLFLFFAKHLLAVDQYNITSLGNKDYPFDCSSIWGYTDSITNKQYALVGTYFGMSVVDLSNMQEVDTLSGSPSIWREIKTYKHYAYVVHDVNGNQEGLKIVDLQYLPDSVKTYNIRTMVQGSNTITFNQQHTCYVDEQGYLYINGGSTPTQINGVNYNGTVIFDLKPNPLQPTYVGKASIRYVHDCFARDTLLFEAHTNNPNGNKFTIWNIKNRSNPILLQDYQTPYGLTHNAWLSDNSKTLFVTHEISSMPIESYDISTINNIIQLQTFKNTPTESAIAHNVHVLNDFLVVPYYTRGLVVFDALDPSNIIRIGYYDTSPSYSGGSFNGAWGAYPYFINGKVVVSDIETGLHVLQPNYIRAARIQGVVTDTNTHIELAGVKISFIDTAINILTNIDGIYKTGSVKSGTTNFKAEKTGYITKYFTADLVNGATKVVDLQLRQIPVYVTRNIAICEGSTYTFADGTDSVITVAGAYYTNLITPTGKDSIIITNIALKSKSYDTLDVKICPNSVYFTPSGRPISQAGTYYDTLSNSLRCDSIVTIHLTIKQTSAVVINDGFCQGTTYTLPNGNTTNVAGTYNFTYQNSVGCDSFITVNLIEKQHSTTILNESFCQGTIYNLPDGSTTSTAGTYNFTFQNTVGCDSFITVNLIEKQHSTTILNESFCQGTIYTLPDGSTTNTAGTYNFTFQNTVGCDSFVTVNITQNPTYSTFIVDSIQSGSYYTLPNGDTTYVGGNFINNLSSVYGCDSVISVQLSIFDTTITTGILNLTNNKDISFYYLNSTIRLNIKNNNLRINTLNIYNSIGKEIIRIKYPENEILLSGLQNGIYFLQLTTNIGQIYSAKFIKQE